MHEFHQISHNSHYCHTQSVWSSTAFDTFRLKNALKKTTGIIRKYKTIEDTLERANHHGKIAKDALEIFPDDPFKDALMKLVDFSIVRSN